MKSIASQYGVAHERLVFHAMGNYIIILVIQSVLKNIPTCLMKMLVLPTVLSYFSCHYAFTLPI